MIYGRWVPLPTHEGLSILINGYILSYVIGSGKLLNYCLSPRKILIWKVRLVTRDVSSFFVFLNVSSDLADSIRPEWDPEWIQKGSKGGIPIGISSTKILSFHHSVFDGILSSFILLLMKSCIILFIKTFKNNHNYIYIYIYMI